MCIFTYGVACVLGLVMLCCCHCLRWACLMLSISTVFLCASWVLVCNLFFDDATSSSTWSASPNCYKLKTDYKYGACFALLVTGWCLDIVDMVFLMASC